jgi:hypothetical protein
LRLRISVQNQEYLNAADPPFIFVLQQRLRRHFMDYLAIYRSVPAPMAKRLFFAASLLGSGWVQPVWKSEFLVGPAAATLLFFPYVPFPSFGHARSGLMQCCEWFDRGYSPVLTWRPGAALMATQTQARIVPVHVSSSFFEVADQWRPRLIVSFGKPIALSPDFHPFLAYRFVEERLKDLERDSLSRAAV